jgi:hypothetical protein
MAIIYTDDSSEKVGDSSIVDGDNTHCNVMVCKFWLKFKQGRAPTFRVTFPELVVLGLHGTSGLIGLQNRWNVSFAMRGASIFCVDQMNVPILLNMFPQCPSFPR